MAEQRQAAACDLRIEGMIDARIDDQLDRGAASRAAYHPALAVPDRRPVVGVADHDQRGKRKFDGGGAAWRIERDNGLVAKLIRNIVDVEGRGDLQPDAAALRTANQRDAPGIDIGKLCQVAERAE